MTHYELLYILPGTLSEEEVVPVTQKVETLLKEAGVAALEHYDLGKSRLAYPMRQIRYGYFRICRFQSEKTEVQEIQKKLRLMGEALLRSLVQVYDPALGILPVVYQSLQQPKPGKKSIDPTLPEGEAEAHKAPAPVKKAEERSEEKVSLEQIDKALDKILDKDIAGV